MHLSRVARQPKAFLSRTLMATCLLSPVHFAHPYYFASALMGGTMRLKHLGSRFETSPPEFFRPRLGRCLRSCFKTGFEQAFFAAETGFETAPKKTGKQHGKFPTRLATGSKNEAGHRKPTIRASPFLETQAQARLGNSNKIRFYRPHGRNQAVFRPRSSLATTLWDWPRRNCFGATGGRASGGTRPPAGGKRVRTRCWEPFQNQFRGCVDQFLAMRHTLALWKQRNFLEFLPPASTRPTP